MYGICMQICNQKEKKKEKKLVVTGSPSEIIQVVGCWFYLMLWQAAYGNSPFYYCKFVTTC